MRTVLIMAGLTFREAARRKTMLAAVVLGAGFLLVYAVGFYYINADVERHADLVSMVVTKEMRNFMLMAGLYVVNFLSMAMAALTSIDTLAGEMASGTVQTLVAKPLRRWQIVIGKWLGFVGMQTLYLLMMGGGVLTIIYVISGHQAHDPMLGLALIWLNALLLLNVSFFGGSCLSTLANGVLAFGLYGIAFVGGWIEQIGWFAEKSAAVNVGILSSLVYPGEALWKRAAFDMQSPLIKALGVSPFSSLAPPNALMIAYAALYALVALLLAVHKFSRRDL